MRNVALVLGTTINVFWHGELSPLELVCMRSFASRGYRVALWAFEGAVPNPPDFVELADAAAILPRSELFEYAVGPGRGSVSAFSNVFRYELLYRLGGWYVDADVVLIAARVPDASVFLAYQSELRDVNGAVLRFPPGHPVVAYCRDEVRTKSREQLLRVRWGEIGPDLLTKAVAERGGDLDVFPPQAAYPIPWQSPLDLYDPRALERCTEAVQESTFVHLWNEMLRKYCIDKSALPPAGSYLRSVVDAEGAAEFFTLQFSEWAVDQAKMNAQLRAELESREMVWARRVGGALRRAKKLLMG
jgi:hypothetical protein